MSSNFVNKIFNAEVSPPPSVWNSIAAELDKLKHPNFVDKIAAVSIEPPSSVWENVASSLGGAERPRRFLVNAGWIKWAAAAAVIGLIVISTRVIFTSEAVENAVSASIPKKENDVTASNNAMKGFPSTAADIHPSIAFVGNQRLISSVRNSPSDADQQKSLVRHALIESTEVEKTKNKSEEGESKISDDVSSAKANFIPPPDYFVVTAPNGERVRISSKFSDAVTSLYGGDNVDYLWKSRFDSWKSKLMYNPSFIPAAGNFLDIAELKDLLKEQ